jgi:hypothetical protein
LSASTDSPCGGGASIGLATPMQCWFFNYTGEATTWFGGYVTQNQGWQITAHASDDCSGTPLATFLPSDGQTCKKFLSGAITFLATPLFNWG